MLETVLMRAFLMIYATDSEGDDNQRPCQSSKSTHSQRRAFTLLSSVCWAWYYTLTGWPDSPTGQWVKHQLTKLIRRECTTLVTYAHTYKKRRIVRMERRRSSCLTPSSVPLSNQWSPLLLASACIAYRCVGIACCYSSSQLIAVELSVVQDEAALYYWEKLRGGLYTVAEHGCSGVAVSWLAVHDVIGK